MRGGFALLPVSGKFPVSLPLISQRGGAADSFSGEAYPSKTHAVNFTACVLLFFLSGGNSPCFSASKRQAGFQFGDTLVDDIRQILLIQVVRRDALDAADPHDFGGDADGGGVGGPVFNTTLPAPTRTLSPI